MEKYIKTNNPVTVMKKIILFMITVLMLGFAVNAHHTPYQQQIIYYDFQNNGDAFILDQSGNDNNAVHIFGDWNQISDGKWGNAIDMGGGTFSYDVTLSLQQLATFTNFESISYVYWFRTDTSQAGDTAHGSVFGSNLEYSVLSNHLNGTTTLSFRYPNATLGVETLEFHNFTDGGSWNFIYYELDAQNNKFSYSFNNDTAITSYNLSNGLAVINSTYQFRTGANSLFGEQFNGDIDEWRVISNELNITQILGLYHFNTANLNEPPEVPVLELDGVVETVIISEYSPEMDENVTNEVDFSATMLQPATCDIYINNALETKAENMLQFTYDKYMYNGQHKWNLYCYVINNNTLYYDITNDIYFNVGNGEPTEVSFEIQARDYDINNESLYIVTPCMNEGYSAIGMEDYQPYRAKYNPNGIKFAPLVNGFATLNVSSGKNEFCLFNGVVNYNTEDYSNDYTMIKAYKQAKIGEIDIPNNVTSVYTYSTNLEDIYQFTNPKAHGSSWTAIFASLLLLAIGVGIILAGARAESPKTVIGGVICVVLALGFTLPSIALLVGA